MAPSSVTPTMGRDSSAPVLLRDDIMNLQNAYFDKGQDLPLKKLAMEKLLWAFHKLQLADTKSRDSFFQIAGYHGMPFRGAGWGNPDWWGGYCNHGNVLFPTWHRAYLVRLENALREVSGYDDITLPYWNETGDMTLNDGIPRIFLVSKVKIPSTVTGKGVSESDMFDNPLRSYKFQDGISDNLNPIPDADYSKPRNYETKRYPFSGLVSGGDGPATKQHNNLVAMLETDDLLNKNVENWLNYKYILNSDGEEIPANAYDKYKRCINAPSYTIFSNTTSAAQYNEDTFNNTDENNTASVDEIPLAMSLESPHNDMHLAIGGFAIPGQGNVDPVIGANGDMGENDTAAFDPIFYFHHCFIDKVFWDWQRNWDAELKSRTQLVIDVGYPGTNSVDSQGPTPGVAGNTWLTMESPLAPFTQDDTQDGKPLTSNDVVDIVGQLRYRYYDDDENICRDKGKESGRESEGGGIKPGKSNERGKEESQSTRVQVVRVSGVNRAAVPGSFVLVVRAVVNGEDCVVGTESVLSRWKVSGCANCQNHLGVKAFLPLVGLDDKALATVRVGMHGRAKRIDDLNGDPNVGGSWRLGKMDMPTVSNLTVRGGGGTQQ